MRILFVFLVIMFFCAGPVTAQTMLDDRGLRVRCSNATENEFPVHCTLREHNLRVIDIFQIANPTRLVVDLGRRPRGGSKSVAASGINNLAMIRTGWHPDKYRIVFDITAGSASYSWKKTGDTVQLEFAPGVTQPAIINAEKLADPVATRVATDTMQGTTLTKSIASAGLTTDILAEAVSWPAEPRNPLDVPDDTTANEVNPATAEDVLVTAANSTTSGLHTTEQPELTVDQQTKAELPEVKSIPIRLLNENPFGESIAVSKEKSEATDSCETESNSATCTLAAKLAGDSVTQTKKPETLLATESSAELAAVQIPDTILPRPQTELASLAVQDLATLSPVAVPIPAARQNIATAMSPVEEPVQAKPLQSTEAAPDALETTRARLNPGMLEPEAVLPDGQFLKGITFIENTEESPEAAVVHLLLTKKPHFNLSRTGARTYRLRIIDGEVAKTSLTLPFFPPHTFPGISFVQAKNSNKRIDITIGVERNTRLMAITNKDRIELKLAQ